MRQAKVMVALQDREHVNGLVRLACEIARATSANVMAFHVVEVGLGLPLDANSEALDHAGKELLALAHQVASQRSLNEFSSRLVRAREAGAAIVREAAAEGV